MRDLQSNFNKVLYGTIAPTAWSDITCAQTANNLLGFAVSNKYTERNFQEQAKTETELLVSNLKVAFKTLVDEASWMDGATKTLAREKVDGMLENVAYPDWIKNKTELENYYNRVVVTRTEHFNNLQSANAFINHKRLMTLRKQIVLDGDFSLIPLL